MILQAVFFAPFRFATGTFEIMALLRFNNTAIALCQGLKAGVTEALVETFVGFTSAGNTVDFSKKREGDEIPDMRIHRDQIIADWELVLNGLFQRGDELLYIA